MDSGLWGPLSRVAARTNWGRLAALWLEDQTDGMGTRVAVLVANREAAVEAVLLLVWMGPRKAVVVAASLSL